MTDKLSLQEWQTSSYLGGANAAYIEELYENYLKDPSSIDQKWRDYFRSLANGSAALEVSHADIRDEFRYLAKTRSFQPPVSVVDEKQASVNALIEAYRRFGHLNAKINPLGVESLIDPRLQLSHYNLSKNDLEKTVATKELLDQPTATLNAIFATLNKIYCGTIGVEYSSISDERERHWLREYVEKKIPATQYSKENKRHILKQLIASETMEKYLDKKYVGQKRYSIEGGDSLIPMLDQLAERAREQKLEEIVIGMAHRGRLNVLLNIMGQSAEELFQEFEGRKEYGLTSGDVKYHRGYSRDVQTAAGAMHLSLAFNPSHLEFIAPVIAGSVRARQERVNGSDRDYAMAVMIHGDAAFAGQGVVMETLSMSQTRAHHIGGSIHIILNNQIGFTTSDPHDARSSHYCSDLAKMLDAPIFHVNGDDPEAVVAVTQLALDYRMTFHKDIFIDLVCYRRHGHQEVDEPMATQPMMYQLIKNHPTTMAIYAEKCLRENVVMNDEVTQWIDEYRARLDKGQRVVDVIPSGLSKHYAENWTPYIGQVWTRTFDTTVAMPVLKQLAQKLTEYPEHFVLQRQVNAIMQARVKMAAGEQPLDWGFAETLGYATLANEGHPVRLDGEDCRRGTFFHRQSTLFDQNTGETFMPLQHLSDKQAKVQIYDSLLSETGVLAFEYGYSTSAPKTLVIWEAQFGDFANGAQVIIDQFISSGWQKWERLSGLVMFLPHGYEGMGPEHSSARLERYLQLAAQDNIQVCVPTTPSQIFHLIRRQALRPYRKPLIVMTPKSLLRHKLAVSSLEDLSTGKFEWVIPEIDQLDKSAVTKVIMCSGKVYYDLLMKRREKELTNVAIIRIEQLYPFPYDELKAVLKTYPNAKQFIWCQEEPLNQGAWYMSRHRLLRCVKEGVEVLAVARKSSAAPAVGYSSLHHQEQEQLIEEALS